MHRRIITGVASMLITLCLNAQVVNPRTTEDAWVKAYTLAASLEDFESARTCLIHLLAVRPDKQYHDALLKLYYRQGSYAQCLQLLSACSDKNYEDVNSLEIKAFSQKNSGQSFASLESFEQLLHKTGNLSYAYEMAQLHLLLRQDELFLQCLTRMRADPRIDGLMVTIRFEGKDGNQQVQQVPMRAALLNLNGYAQLADGHKKEGRKYFREALQVKPDFHLAKGNLASVGFSWF